MKGFNIAELLIYDPTRPSPKKKPIEIDIQQAKIIVYYPHQVELEQKCNTVGMAEGVFNFCHTLFTGKEEKEGKEGQQKQEKGFQVIFMDCCTLVLSEVEENIWMFVKLEHDLQSKYYRPGQGEQNYYLDQSFTQHSCKLFMKHLYQNFRLFYGSIRGWVFRQKFEELQHIVTAFVIRYQQIYRLDQRLDVLSYSMRDLRLIPLDVNSTLKFSYFKNVLQSYNPSISHLIVYSYGVLAFSSLGKSSTQLISKYLFSTGEPYIFQDQLKTRMVTLPELPKTYISQKFGFIYNTKVVGFQQTAQNSRSSLSTSKMQGVDLLGLQNGNNFQFFQVYLQQQENPLKISFFSENNMFFVSLFKQNPSYNELIFQNRFFHDNSDRFIVKINESLPNLIKPNDPYKFIFHNCGTFTGKSTIKQWKNLGGQLTRAFQLLQANNEGVIATTTQAGLWIYGIHRFSRILILLVSMDFPLNRVEEYMSKMTKQYFTRAYV